MRQLLKTELEEINDFCGADKAQLLSLYNPFFQEIRDDEIKILEMGVQTGNSLVLWMVFFPKAKIVGIDINPMTKSIPDPRVKFIQGDATSDENLQKLIDLGPYNIIIDDCNYWNSPMQVKAFKTLFPHCQDFYCMEDIGNSIKTGDVVGLINDVSYALQGPDNMARLLIEQCPIEIGEGIRCIHVFHQLLLIEKRKTL